MGHHKLCRQCADDSNVPPCEKIANPTLRNLSIGMRSIIYNFHYEPQNPSALGKEFQLWQQLLIKAYAALHRQQIINADMFDRIMSIMVSNDSSMDISYIPGVVQYGDDEGKHLKALSGIFRPPKQ